MEREIWKNISTRQSPWIIHKNIFHQGYTNPPLYFFLSPRPSMQFLISSLNIFPARRVKFFSNTYYRFISCYPVTAKIRPIFKWYELILPHGRMERSFQSSIYIISNQSKLISSRFVLVANIFTVSITNNFSVSFFELTASRRSTFRSTTSLLIN